MRKCGRVYLGEAFKDHPPPYKGGRAKRIDLFVARSQDAVMAELIIRHDPFQHTFMQLGVDPALLAFA